MARRSRRRGSSHRARADTYGQRARREGYPARSVYKLEEIDRRVRLFRAGQRVLDLGAAPGSWCAYAARRVGTGGRVLGVDTEPHRTELPQHVEVLQQDVQSLDPDELGQFDIVLSDMAPPTTGQKHVDQTRSFELFMRALDIAEQVLVPGGTFVGKLFEGPDTQQAHANARRTFGKVRILRPKATRSESSETFVVGLSRK